MKISVLGTGTVGKSWVALFLAHGFEVSTFDNALNYEASLIEFIDSTRDALRALGLSQPDLARLHCYKTASDAVIDVVMVQENVSEELSAKHGIYQEIEPHLAEQAIVLSSTSGLTLHELQRGFSDPSRIVIAHPFNPPHLIPLVEVLGNSLTKHGIVSRVMKFYESIGKIPIELKKSVPGHIANRLQAVIWQEALALAKQGVASLEDIDKAVSSGPGLRWAIFGPNQLFALGAGDRGLNGFIDQLGPSFQSWWSTASEVTFDAEMRAFLAENDLANQTLDQQSNLIRQRDDLLVKFITERQKSLK